MNVSRETMVRLETYAALLKKWNPAINLVAKSTIADLWGRHILDSAQVFDLCPDKTAYWVDFGSGGGFPGLVVAIMAAELRPEIRFTLVESDQRKATFLRTVVRDVGITVDIQGVRAEQMDPLGADVMSARALAPLSQLLTLAERHLKPAGSAILLKGAQADAEIEEALASWRFTVQKTKSKTEPQAVVLTIGDIVRA